MYSIKDFEEAAKKNGVNLKFPGPEEANSPAENARRDGAYAFAQHKSRLQRQKKSHGRDFQDGPKELEYDRNSPAHTTLYSQASTPTFSFRATIIDEMSRALVIFSDIVAWGGTAIDCHGEQEMWKRIELAFSKLPLALRTLPTLAEWVPLSDEKQVDQLRTAIFDAFYRRVQNLCSRQDLELEIELELELERLDKFSEFWNMEGLRSELNILLSLCRQIRDEFYEKHTATVISFGEPFEKETEQEEVNYVVDLALLKYCKAEFPDQHRVDLSTVVTLTGTLLYAYASTCGEYIEQHPRNVFWGNLAGLMLNLLQQALDLLMDQDDVNHISVEHKFLLEDREPVTLRFDLYRSERLEAKLVSSRREVRHTVTKILSWFMIVFSSSPWEEARVFYCDPIIETQTMKDQLEMTTLHLFKRFRLPHSSENPCWLSLFSNATIARGFYIPERHHGQGLEISTDLMASIIGARHISTYDGGVVMKGYSSILLPARRTFGFDIKTGINQDGIQWHYVANDDPDEPLSYAEGVARCPGRALEDTIALSQIGKETRCFIGWTRDAKLGLGNPRCDYEKNRLF